MAARILVFGLLVACAFAAGAKPRSGKEIGTWKQSRLGDTGLDVVIATCLPPTSPFVQYQQWTFGDSHELKVKATGACLDIADYSTDDEAEVYTYSPCHPEDHDPKHQNEAWSYNTNHTITALQSGKCLDRSNYATNPGAQVWLYHCTGAFNQQWVYNSTDLTIRAIDSGLCLDAGSPQPRACDVAPLKGTPFCDTSLSHDTRAAYVVRQLQPAEKVGLLVNTARGVSRLNLPSYEWWSEALHGVGGSPGVHFGGPTPAATSFPQVCLTSASFNKTLFRAIGSAISTEARAMNNVGRAGLTFWAPNVNIFRDPRWGRGQETPGEDPYLTSEYAANFVPGMQDGEDLGYLKVSSCCKHYFDYNLEDWHGMDRYHFDAITTDQDLADTYLPAFASCVVRGRASSLMCSYNAVNGIPSCANGGFMDTVARETWGFDGYITSDCGAVDCVYNAHHYTNTTGATCDVTLSAGMDIECGSFFTSYLGAAMASGEVSNSVVDSALHNLFRVQLRLGLFDPLADQVYTKYNYTDKINTKAHQELALSAAQQGVVLLKNENKLLPLSGKPRIALIGPNADATVTMQGNYYGTPPFIITPSQGLSSYTTVTLTKGCDVSCDSSVGFAAAQAAAAAADQVVLIAGLDQNQESEGHDREILSFPGKQSTLISLVAAAAKRPIILVVMAGGPVDLTDARANPRIGAILWVGYPGQAGGQALADVIFGTVNPGGRLTTSVYPASFINVASMFNVNMRPNATSGYPGRSYRFYTGQAPYTFGDGLSYTTFNYSTPDTLQPVSLSQIAGYASRATTKHQHLRTEAPVLQWITITVTNTGSVAGSDVVLLFVQSPTPGSSGAPLRTLAGFERVFLQPGQSIEVPFSLTEHDFTLTGADGALTTQRGTWTIEVGKPTGLVLTTTVA